VVRLNPSPDLAEMAVGLCEVIIRQAHTKQQTAEQLLSIAKPDAEGQN
jgi:hypothetical protein